MTAKDTLHHLVDELPEEQNELARTLLEDLRDSADTEVRHWIAKHLRPWIAASATSPRDG